MNSMIDALLALSRLSTQSLERITVDLSDLARQVIAELRAQAPERQVDVMIADGLTALGDPTLLRMVLDNLLGNAWKYSSKREHARIEFGRLDDADGPPTFYVRDNGAGFDMRFAGKLFGAFQRLHGATEFAGTGIGLASVRRIVRRHGGDIRAEAAVDRGATFYFTLA
jgi:light-regulated signal transduction histidine kinase (bacteriophytochrome)